MPTPRSQVQQPPESHFTVYPCVDIQGGRAVRLLGGDPDKQTVYFADPRRAAEHWISLGARELHLVDLDAATGRGENRELIGEVAALARDAGARVEVGGGIRSEAAARSYLTSVDRVVLGTVAVTQPELVARLVAEFGPERVAVSVDARAGMVAVRGWLEASSVSALDLADEMAGRGVRHLIYTDIDRDGTMQGVDLEPVRALRAAYPYLLVAGGGVASDADLDMYARLGLQGAIVGRALYEGKIAYPRTA